MISRRTIVVISLLAVAVLVPSGAWLVSAQREADRRLERLVHEADARLQAELGTRAGRLAARLESLRRTEAQRPFYHYQNLTHEPRGASEGVSIIPSPLATGVADPLIRAHFQIAPDGRISLPTVNEDFPEFSIEDGFAMYCSLLGELEQALSVNDAGLLARSAAGGAGTERPDRGRVVVLESRQWHQIEDANRFYAELAGEQRAADVTEGAPRRGDSGMVRVLVGPLAWHTVLIGSGPMLAALRQVDTPSGILVQGFAIAEEVARGGALAGSLPEFVADPNRDGEWLAAAVGDSGWSLAVDASPVRAQARTLAASETEAFWQRFALVVGAALFAALCVAVIVAEVERTARQRARFAAAAAHELKTPLATLQLYSEMLADGLGDPSRSAEYAERVAQESARLGRVVTNILDLARLERGTPLARACPGDLAAAVHSSLDRLRPNLVSRGVTLDLESTLGQREALFDCDALDQILANLLDNAERYSRDSGERRVGVAVAATAEMATVTVRDSGPGVPESARHRIFRPFSRGAQASGPQGLGLGLALARALARAQGGELRLLDSPEGAVFQLSLPLVTS